MTETAVCKWCTCSLPFAVMRTCFYSPTGLCEAAEPSPAVPDSQNYASSMPHVNCTGPCCRPDLWKAAIKGSVTSEAQTVPIPEDLRVNYENWKVGRTALQYPDQWMKVARELIERIARAEATIAELVEHVNSLPAGHYSPWLTWWAQNARATGKESR